MAEAIPVAQMSVILACALRLFLFSPATVASQPPSAAVESPAAATAHTSAISKTTG